MTALTARQVLMVVLCFVMFIGGMLGTVFIMLPSYNETEASRNTAIGSIVIASLAFVWFVKLCFDAIRDKRRGILRAPAKIGGRFHIWFGLLAAVGGVACSWLTLDAARQSGGGYWTLYYGMIVWGTVQMLYGWNMLRRERDDAAKRAGEVS